MKKLKIVLLTAVIAAMTQTSFSQFYAAGLQLSRISGGSGIIKNIGIHGTGEYMFDEKTGVVGSIGFFLPHKFDSEMDLNARNSIITPRTITVTSKDKISGYQLAIMAKRLFVNEYEEEGFGLYGLGGIGFTGFTYKTEMPSYDEANYGLYTKDTYEEPQSYANATFILGLGASIQTESGLIYLEPVLNIPGNQDNAGNYVAIEIPMTLQINLGYRIVF